MRRSSPIITFQKKPRGEKAEDGNAVQATQNKPCGFLPDPLHRHVLDWRVVRLRQHELFLVAFRDQYLQGRFRQ